MSAPTVEEAQTIVLKAIDASPNGEVADTRELTTASGGSLKSSEAQAVVKAALDSLLSKEVSRVTLAYAFM